MKSIMVLFFLLVSFTTFSQNQEPVSSNKKQERKAEKNKQKEWMAQVTKEMIENRSFVLEAEYLNNNNGNRILVNSMVNFIIVDSTTCTIQLGTTSGTGYGGTGMLTLEGQINSYKYQKTEKKHFNAYYVSYTVFSSQGTYMISLYVTDDGMADATIQGSTSGQLTYSGKIFPLSASHVYKGPPRY
jgi:hypothetical protein